jgi:hypothetical protein
MAKYFPDNTGSASAPIGSPGCKGLPGGYINDTIGKMCWAVTGQRIVIGDTAHSVQAAAECCNFNFKVAATQSPVPTRFNLRGMGGLA